MNRFVRTSLTGACLILAGLLAVVAVDFFECGRNCKNLPVPLPVDDHEITGRRTPAQGVQKRVEEADVLDRRCVNGFA